MRHQCGLPGRVRSDLPQALAGVSLLFSGSAALPTSVQDRIHAATGQFVHEGYGLTEAAPGVSSTVVSGVAKPGSVGQPFPGVDVRLVDDDGPTSTRRTATQARSGSRARTCSPGTGRTVPDGPDADGWYATGDVAYADDDGDLHIVDRRKELIIVSGFNVYPHEVEEVLQQHPGVVEAAVVGVPNPTTGEAVKAYVVARVDGEVTADELLVLLRARWRGSSGRRRSRSSMSCRTR